MTPVLARIVSRYLAGALVSYGLVGVETGAALAVDPDLAILIGAVLGAATEVIYAIAKRKGWAT